MPFSTAFSTQAGYAPFILNTFGTAITADASYSAPTEGTLGADAVACSNGARIDQLSLISQGTSVAGICRLFQGRGIPGAAITSIIAVAGTATVTTTTPHGLTTGDYITVQRAFPYLFNVRHVACTVLSTTTFSYALGATPPLLTAVLTAAATNVLATQYSSMPAVGSYKLLGEILITANVGSSTNPVWQKYFTSVGIPGMPAAPGAIQMPIWLGPGDGLFHTVSVTQTNALLCGVSGGHE